MQRLEPGDALGQRLVRLPRGLEVLVVESEHLVDPHPERAQLDAQGAGALVQPCVDAGNLIGEAPAEGIDPLLHEGFDARLPLVAARGRCCVKLLDLRGQGGGRGFLPVEAAVHVRVASVEILADRAQRPIQPAGQIVSRGLGGARVRRRPPFGGIEPAPQLVGGVAVDEGRQASFQGARTFLGRVAQCLQLQPHPRRVLRDRRAQLVAVDLAVRASFDLLDARGDVRCDAGKCVLNHAHLVPGTRGDIRHRAVELLLDNPYLVPGTCRDILHDAVEPP